MENPLSNDTVTNDDALVDCLLYGISLRSGIRKDGEYPEWDVKPMDIAKPRTISDPPPPGSACSVTMCGYDDDAECRMIRYCENGHCMHDKCIENLMSMAPSMYSVYCPQCRSEHAIELLMKTAPMVLGPIQKKFLDHGASIERIFRSRYPNVPIERALLLISMVSKIK